ncbi:MAG: hypothetical protein WAU36_09865 [Cyclobacteriaceae bacterium]
MKYGIYFIFLLSLNGFAQIQVHEEPLHHPVFRNENARILDVIAHPNDTSLIHQHSYNYCYVTIDGGKIWVENKGEDGRTLELPVGFTGGYFENPQQPLVHRFANRSDGLIRLIAIENLTHGNTKDSIHPLLTNEELLINNHQFLVTKISLSPSQQLDFHSTLNTIIVNTGQTPLSVNIKSEELADWRWLNAGSQISIYNQETINVSIVLVGLKSSD